MLNFSKFTLENSENSEVINELLEHLERLDSRFIENSQMEDEEITFTTSKGERSAMASTILSQMIFHAAEHRAQIIAALDKHNERSINLDDYDVWSYIAKN